MIMREILFKGKRVDNGEWVYGSLVNNLFFRNNNSPINYIAPNDFDYDCREDVREFADMYEVIPETVGQYTGLTDKNGTKIFEGDIVKTFKYNETEYRERVYFFNGCFFYGSWNWIEFRNAFRELEIIGNIFDNPKLLQL